MINKTVLIFRGTSGSGKTTYIKNNFPTATVCSADHFFINEEGQYNWQADKLYLAHKACMDKFKSAIINNDQLIVIDNTNTKHEQIKPYVEFAKANNYIVKAIYMQVPLQKLFGRNVHGVSDTVVERMFNQIKPIPAHWNVEQINITQM